MEFLHGREETMDGGLVEGEAGSKLSDAHFRAILPQVPAAFPKLNGLALLLTGVFCSPAGFIGGKLFDVYGNYTLAFELNMLVVAGGGVALFLRQCLFLRGSSRAEEFSAIVRGPSAF
jgi:hypothetical protein